MPPQDVVTRDNVTLKVNAVVYFRVVDPTKAVIEVTNFLYATSQVSQTTLRSVLGEAELDELLSQRENSTSGCNPYSTCIPDHGVSKSPSSK